MNELIVSKIESKQNNPIRIFLILFFATVSLCYAQNNLAVIAKVGKADYFFTRGGAYDYWEDGYHIAGGVEFPLNNHFSFQGLFEYSEFKFNNRFAFGDKINDVRNRVFDLTGHIKWNLGIFYFIGGVGFSLQSSDGVRYLEKTEYHDAVVFHNSEAAFRIAGMLGLGFDVYIYSNFSLIAEAAIRMREYGGNTSLLGVKYEL